jgi:hypothetical protein
VCRDVWIWLTCSMATLATIEAQGARTAAIRWVRRLSVQIDRGGAG